MRNFSPRNKKMLDLLARVICLLLFGITLYQTEYQERKKTGFYVSTEWQWALNAANLGYPFYYYT
ncbi:MAG: hypothetical protein K8I82_28130 [Anaerolineae bacterium]|nr:hypothetical protein [Anaerolineae bacterium]